MIDRPVFFKNGSQKEGRKIAVDKLLSRRYLVRILSRKADASC